MNQTDFRTYKKLKEETFLIEKTVPKNILNSFLFKELLESLILEKVKSGTRFPI